MKQPLVLGEDGVDAGWSGPPASTMMPLAAKISINNK